MMKIKKIFVGNSNEAFVDDSFASGMNILHSYANNKGKTIVMQSIIYSIGGEPMFPESFPYKEYYYVLVFSHNNKEYTICRKNASFVIQTETGFNIFDSYAEYKYFFDKVIFPLPRIIKDGKIKVADIALLSELFFLPQTNRNTANIINYGYYKKQDFENVLYSLAGISPFEEILDTDAIKDKIKILKVEQKELKKEHNILSSLSKGMNIASIEVNRVQFETKLKKIEDIKNKITELINERNRITNGKIKDEMLVKELNSLKRKLPNGELCCLNCGSKNIGYIPSNQDCIFDVSDVKTRQSILNSLSSQIELATEAIEMTTLKIEEMQKILQQLLKEDDIDLATLLLYKPETINASAADERLALINKEITKYNNMLEASSNNTANNRHSMNELMNKIIQSMQWFYSKMEPNGNCLFNKVYTSQTTPFSGSEETEFYLAKLFSYAKEIPHPFPILVDGFREGEIDSDGEKTILSLFKELNNQIIFTATLKDEEQSHYQAYEHINAVDYSKYTDSHILNKRDVQQLLDVLSHLGIVIS